MFKTYAYFYIEGFEGKTEAISRRLELEPTEAWLEGEDYLPGRPRKFSSWARHSALERSEMFMDAHIKSVLDIIEPKREEILKLRNEGCDIGINCIGYYRGENSGFHLDAELIARLAAFLIDVDLDLYCSGKE